MGKKYILFELENYIKLGDLNRAEKAENWNIAIGLQDVDNLKTSNYLMETAREHIDGDIDIKTAVTRIDSYYSQKSDRIIDEGEEEADKVSVRIAMLLNEKQTFNFSPAELKQIHFRLFDGLIASAGEYRTYNISKKEWILNQESVLYAPFQSIEATLG